MIDQDSASEGEAFGARDTGTIDDLVRDLLLESDETAIMYLRESWIASAFALLRDTRRAADLSQQQVADRLGMKQSAIARLEGAEDTKLSTVWKYLTACGQGVADLEAVPLERLRTFALTDSGAPRTAQVVDTASIQWLFDVSQGRRPARSAQVDTSSISIDRADLAEGDHHPVAPILVAA